jgi:hypothetical protein
MPFIKLKNSTTADATDCNNNMYWLGQGSVLPMEGEGLENTDSACDLGSSTTTWNNSYIENIYYDTITKDLPSAKYFKHLPTLILEETLANTATSIQFDLGFTASAFLYRSFVVYYFSPSISGDNYLNVIDSTLTAYYQGFQYGADVTFTKGGYISICAHFFLGITSGGSIFSKINLLWYGALSGVGTVGAIIPYCKIHENFMQLNDDTTVYAVGHNAGLCYPSIGMWATTSTKLVLTFWASSGLSPGTHIEIWEE